MNPDFLPQLGASLRALGEYATRHEVTDETLAAVAAELDRARSLVRSARGETRVNRCTRHPGGPVDPTADNGCLLCGNTQRRPSRPVPDDFVPGDVLDFLQEHGHDAATHRYGPQAVARAVAIGGRHPSTHQRPGTPAQPHDNESENPHD